MKITNPGSTNPGSKNIETRVAQGLKALHDIAYALITPELTISYASENITEYLSEPLSTIQGAKLSQLFWEFIGIEQILDDVMDGKISSHHLNYVNRVAPGRSVAYLNLTILPFDNQEPGSGLLLLIEDVTQTGKLEHKLAQERNELRLTRENLAAANRDLIRLDQLKSLFLSLVAHDLRTPLSAILGYVELTRTGLSQQNIFDFHQFLTVTINQIKWLNRLISDILDLDQIEQGQLSIIPKSFVLSDLIQITVRTLEETAFLRDQKLSLILPPDQINIIADADRIQQILYNIITNAIKYSPDKGIIIISLSANNGYAIIKVSDSGVGMSEEEQAQLFQLYYRTIDARRSNVKGSGLGLFIVKSLVEAHNGSIRLKSDPGKGTTVTVSLPLSPSNPKQIGA